MRTDDSSKPLKNDKLHAFCWPEELGGGGVGVQCNSVMVLTVYANR